MKVAVIDVGSNTARLLVADVSSDGEMVELARERSYLSLGTQLARNGRLSEARIAKAASVAARFAARADEHEAERVETIVTAPGRHGQSAGVLAHALHQATCWPVRVLSTDEEGRLAYDGAVARAGELPEVVAVVDVGGGSTEIVIGTPLLGAAWVRSLDTGSLRLKEHYLTSDPPSKPELAAARTRVQSALADLDPPRPDVALATGGSARAIARVVGPIFSADDLKAVIRLCKRHPSKRVAQTFAVHPSRAGTMAGGAIVLAEVSRQLGLPLELARGGLREGAALSLALSARAAAA